MSPRPQTIVWRTGPVKAQPRDLRHSALASLALRGEVALCAMQGPRACLSRRLPPAWPFCGEVSSCWLEPRPWLPDRARQTRRSRELRARPRPQAAPSFPCVFVGGRQTTAPEEKVTQNQKLSCAPSAALEPELRCSPAAATPETRLPLFWAVLSSLSFLCLSRGDHFWGPLVPLLRSSVHV